METTYELIKSYVNKIQLEMIEKGGYSEEVYQTLEQLLDNVYSALYNAK